MRNLNQIYFMSTTLSRKVFLLQDEQVVKLPDDMCGKGLANRHLIARCASCLNEVDIIISCYWKLRKLGPWICYECRKPELKSKAQANPLYKNEAYKDRFRKLHYDPAYAAAVHNDIVNATIAESTRTAWKDPQKRANHLAHRQTNEFKDRISKWSRTLWGDPDYRAHQVELRSKHDYIIAASLRAKALWQDPAYRKVLEEVLNKARPNSYPKTNISCLQRILYNVLGDMGLTYYEEGPKTVVGPIITTDNRFEGYSFDCLLEHQGRKIYIECQGDYWHRGREARDSAKATFLTRYFPDSELLVIWEHEYRSPGRVKSIIEERLCIKIEPIDFSFHDISVGNNPPLDDLKSLFAKYHYLANIGRVGSARFGAVLNKTLIAGAVFSSPTRQESLKKQGVQSGGMLELSRFCIAPQYQKKNFATWFLSRAVNLVWKQYPKVSRLLTFADTTYGHTGTIYRASNWILDGIVKPDYWYIGSTGEWYHKKSIWDLASKNSMTEVEYATTHNLRRVIGKEKLRFIKKRP